MRVLIMSVPFLGGPIAVLRTGGLTQFAQGLPGKPGKGFGSDQGWLLYGLTGGAILGSAGLGRAIGIAGAPLEVWVEGSALEVLAEGAPGEALAGAARVATVPARAASPNREAAAALARRVLIT